MAKSIDKYPLKLTPKRVRNVIAKPKTCIKSRFSNLSIDDRKRVFLI